jgi:hypothetical protein
MKTTPTHLGAGAVSRHLYFNKMLSNHGSSALRGALVCAFLVTLGGLSAQGTSEATYKLFGREVGGYASKDDLPGIIAKQLGARATIADWNEIKQQHGQSEANIKAFCDKVGLAANGSAWVTMGGKRFWENQRHYFAYRADHRLPEDFMLHDQLQNNFLLLGSWYETRPILVKIKDYNAADAAKWAKWDALLVARTKADVSGVYTLVTVNGMKLPATVSHESAGLQIRAGSFTIRADGQCISRMTFVPPSGQETTLERNATYTREGGKLTMQWQGAGRTIGTVEGNTFTMENESMVFAFKK